MFQGRQELKGGTGHLFSFFPAKCDGGGGWTPRAGWEVEAEQSRIKSCMDWIPGLGWSSRLRAGVSSRLSWGRIPARLPLGRAGQGAQADHKRDLG